MDKFVTEWAKISYAKFYIPSTHDKSYVKSTHAKSYVKFLKQPNDRWEIRKLKIKYS